MARNRSARGNFGRGKSITSVDAAHHGHEEACVQRRVLGRRIYAMIIFPVLLFSAQLTMTVADPVPNLNVRPSCQAAANGDIGIKQDMQVCLDDEKSARDQLVKEWNQFSPADRSSCLRLTTTGGNPTYTEYVTCLEMDRDAKKLPKEGTVGLSH
jgi:hypothetical protein